MVIKNKCTLLIDGNWLLQSRMAVMMDQFDKTKTKHELESSQTELIERMARSIIIVLNKFKDIDNFILIQDGGSWRNQLQIPSQLGEKYKGNREHDIEIDWSYIFNSLNKLSEYCKDQNITTSQLLNAEGDDWMWYWSRKLNSEGTNCIIWSSDNDLKQLVQVENGTFTAWYNDKHGLFFHNDLNNEQEIDIDFFLNTNYKSPLFESLQRNTQCSFINPDNIIMSKIICGDSGDNIKSVIKVEKNGRRYGIGNKDWETIRKNLHIDSFSLFLKHIDDIVIELINLKKFSCYNLNKSLVREMIDYNIKLVWLNEQVIPEPVIQGMNNIEYQKCDIQYIRSNYKVLCGEREEKDIMSIFNDI